MVVVVEEVEGETMLVMIISAIISNVAMPKINTPQNTCFACPVFAFLVYGLGCFQ